LTALNIHPKGKTMNIAIIGATGYTGTPLTAEALSRHHHVTAIARKAGQIPAAPGLSAKALDYTDTAALAAALEGKEAVLVAVKFHNADTAPLLQAIKRAGVKRVLVIGGAGSLQAAPGLDVVDTPNFPAEYKEEALAAREFLRTLRKENGLDWTLLSPSALLVPGERTAKYRVGGDTLLVDAQGKSSISIQDLAKALIDELEQPRHIRQRFTVGY